MKSIVFILAGIVVLATVAGCGGPWRQGERVLLLDRKAARYLRARELQPVRLPSGELEINVVLVNVKGKDLPCDVKVNFLDVDGGVIESTSWEPIILERAVEKSIKKNSLDPAAADYRLYVRLQK